MFLDNEIHHTISEMEEELLELADELLDDELRSEFLEVLRELRIAEGE